MVSGAHAGSSPSLQALVKSEMDLFSLPLPRPSWPPSSVPHLCRPLSGQQPLKETALI